jgi:hypothetical protein
MLNRPGNCESRKDVPLPRYCEVERGACERARETGRQGGRDAGRRPGYGCRREADRDGWHRADHAGQACPRADLYPVERDHVFCPDRDVPGCQVCRARFGMQSTFWYTPHVSTRRVRCRSEVYAYSPNAGIPDRPKALHRVGLPIQRSSPLDPARKILRRRSADADQDMQRYLMPAQSVATRTRRASQKQS